MSMVRLPVKLWQSLVYSLQGIGAVFKQDLSFRLEVYIGTIAMMSLCYFSVAPIFKLSLFLLLMLLFTVELINSAIEAAIDRISSEHHPLSKLAKDAGSAAVFFVILMNLVTWVYVLV